jgi:RNA polymerase sigma-70 factor (ECF subfamily)
VVQESFIKIFTGIGEFTYQGKGSLKAWATKIAVNEALMQLRKDKQFIYSLQEAEMGNSPDEDPDTEGLGMETFIIFHTETATRLSGCVQSLCHRREKP